MRILLSALVAVFPLLSSAALATEGSQIVAAAQSAEKSLAREWGYP